MTQDEIYYIARESGVDEWEIGVEGNRSESQSRHLAKYERFAALVAAHEREKLLDETGYLGEQLQAYILAEREACAKVCEDYIDRLHEIRDNDESLPQYQPELAGRQAGAGRCAAAIRARGTL